MFGPMTLFWSYWTRLFLWSFGVFSPQAERAESGSEVADTKVTEIRVADRQAPVFTDADVQVADHPVADGQVGNDPVETESSANRKCPRCAARDLLLLERGCFEQKTADDRRYVHEKWRCLNCGYFEQNIFSL